ncbi:hypothetical protein VNI00_003510 [Paramarasmius palmivorus]|uniref:F-box domain-containing protein n=1 Tax=Paramarasmius palmivorus TaxID=297713 RepID=A0AAW0DPN0_9AGAR
MSVAVANHHAIVVEPTTMGSIDISYSGQDVEAPYSNIPSLAHHLRKNTMPELPYSPEEARARMQQSAQQLEKLRTAIRTLEAEQTALQQYITESQSLSAPIRKLPVEILGDIFSLVCNRGTGNIFGKKSYLPSLYLIGVCSFWRMSCWQGRICGPRLTAAPLHVSVFSGYWSNTSNASSATEWKILSLLLEHAHRWSSATLRLDFQLYVEASAKITAVLEGDDANSDSGYESHPDEPSKPFTRLKVLDLSWFDCRIAAVHSARPVIRLFQYAPALQSLTIHHYDDFFVLPFSQIRNLTVTNVHHSPEPLLSQCSNLERLRLLNFASRELAPEKPVQLSNLTHLEVQVSSYYETLTTKHLFDTLEVPALTAFSIAEPVHRYWDRPTWSQPAFASLLSRSSCSLQQLSFAEVVMAHEELEDTLRLTPALTHLAFIEWQSSKTTKSLLKKLSSDSNQKVIVPSLSHLSLGPDEPLESMVQEMKEMVLLRSRLAEKRGVLTRYFLRHQRIQSSVSRISLVTYAIKGQGSSYTITLRITDVFIPHADQYVSGFSSPMLLNMC